MNFKRILFIGMVLGCLSCTKGNLDIEDDFIYITADAVQARQDGTKTEMDGLDVVWLENEGISLSNGTNYKTATNTNGKGKNGVFQVASKAEGTWYAFHPQQNKLTTNKEAIGEISEKQYPSLTSFDGNSDVLLSEGIDISTTEKREFNTKFHRLCSVIKIVFTDNTEGKTYSQDGDYVDSISFKNGKYALCGRSILDLANCCYKTDGHQTSKTEVMAIYDADDNFVINGTNAAYLIVVPWEITNGYTMFNLYMHNGATYEKKITTYKNIENKCILLEANKVTTFNIKITDK